jgi:hypothetical protein
MIEVAAEEGLDVDDVALQTPPEDTTDDCEQLE